MNSREQAQKALNEMNKELAGWLLDLASARPSRNATASDLFKRADATATALNDSITTMMTKINTLTSDINNTDANTPFTPDLTNRLTDLQTEWKGFFKSDEVKAFNLTYLEYHLAIIQLNLANLDAFQLDVRELGAAKDSRAFLEEVEKTTQERLRNKSAVTISDMIELSKSVEDSVTVMEELARENKELENKCVDAISHIPNYISAFALPDGTDAQLANLVSLATKLKHHPLAQTLTASHEKLQALKTTSEELKTALTTAKDTLSKDANSSKKPTLESLAKLYTESNRITQEIKTTTAEASTLITQANEALKILEAQPIIDQAVIAIETRVRELNEQLEKITDVNFKVQTGILIANLQKDKDELKSPASANKFKDKKEAKEILSEINSFKNSATYLEIIHNKINITALINQLNSYIDKIKSESLLDEFRTKLTLALNELGRTSARLNDPHISESNLKALLDVIDLSARSIKLLPDILKDYHEGAKGIQEIKSTIAKLGSTFPDLIKQLTDEQESLEALLEKVEENLVAALTNPNNKDASEQLKDAISKIKDPEFIRECSLLLNEADKAIKKQSQKEEKDKLAKEIEPLLKTLAETIAAALKEINSIQALDETFTEKRAGHLVDSLVLEEKLKDYETQNTNNSTITLKDNIEKDLKLAEDLKKAAKATREEEAKLFQTAAARTRNENVLKEANAKIKSIQFLLKDYKTRADKIEKYDDTAKSNLTQIQQIIANYEKEYNKLHGQFIENPVVIPTDAKDTADATEFNKAIDAKQKILDDLVALEKNIKEHMIEVSDKDKFTFDQMFNALEEHVKNEKISDQHDSYKETADPNYKYKLDSEKKSFTVLDQSIPQHKARLDRLESLLSAALTSAAVKLQLPEDRVDKSVEKVRDMRRAFNFYINYKNEHAEKGSYSVSDIIQLKEQIGRIEVLATEVKTQQKYVLQGMGVMEIEYHANLAEAEKKLGSINNASLAASSGNGSISSFGLKKQHILISGDEALRREHKMQVTRKDGTTTDLSDTMITFPNPKNGALTSNFYEPKDNAVEIDGLPDVYKHGGIGKLFNGISRPADEILDRVYSRYTTHTADPRYKPGPWFIDPGSTDPQMRPKEILSWALIIKSKGEKINTDCYPLLGKDMVKAITNINDEQIKFVVEYLEKRQLIIKNTTALEIEAASEKAFSRFKAR